MRYTQKDIREKLSLTRDALRLYEQRGIIEPEIDPQNGYRYYDDWQINLLWECKRYQGMGFSLGETQEILASDSLLDLGTRVGAHSEELEQKIRHLQLVLERCRDHQAEIRAIAADDGRIELAQGASYVFVSRREMHELIGSNDPRALALANESIALSTPFFLFPKSSENRYFWGHAIESSVNERLGAPITGRGVIPIEEHTTLSGYFDAGERWHFGLGLFQKLFLEAEARGLAPYGPLYGTLIARTHGNDGAYHRHIQAFLPVNKPK